MFRRLVDPTFLPFWLRPELSRFARSKQAKAALRRALRAVSPAYLLLVAAAWIIPAGAGLLLGHEAWAVLFGRPAASITAFIPRALVVVLPFVGLACCLHLGSLWLVRHHVRRHLYRELNAAGIPTCESCGYDMTLNASGRCPECGTNFGLGDLPGRLTEVPQMGLRSWRGLIAPGLWSLAILLGWTFDMHGAGRWVFSSFIVLGLVYLVWNSAVKRR